MPRKSEPFLIVKTFHVTEPVGVFDQAKVSFWDERAKAEIEGRLHASDVIRSAIVEVL